MKIGIIIIFRNNEPCICVDDAVSDIRFLEDIKFCFVDNYSKDNTLQLMCEIKDECGKDIEIVQIKKVVSEVKAKRAGARFLLNNYDLKQIGYINLEALKTENYSLNDVLTHIVKNKQYIANLKNNLNYNKGRQSLFNSIFSIVDSLKNLNNNPKYLELKI